MVVDLQHGGATEHDLPGLTSAIRLAGATPIGRVRHAHPADIGRALDLGCEGVIVPNVNSAAQAREAAGARRYPPAGYRSGGGAMTGVGEPFCIIMVESAEALADLEATLAEDGVDGIYVGPRDLSYSLGCELDPDDPVLGPALERIRAASPRRASRWASTPPMARRARRYRDDGCSLITVVSDALAVSRGAASEVAAARVDVRLPVLWSGPYGGEGTASRDEVMGDLAPHIAASVLDRHAELWA